MSSQFLNILNGLYPVTASLLILFYIPQIVVVLRAKGPLKEISLWSWGVWSSCSLVTALYALSIARDDKMAFFGFLNTGACSIVFITTLYKRFWKYRNSIVADQL